MTSVTSRDVREKYEIERSQLGHGHYGVVRRCWDKSTREVGLRSCCPSVSAALRIGCCGFGWCVRGGLLVLEEAPADMRRSQNGVSCLALSWSVSGVVC